MVPHVRQRPHSQPNAAATHTNTPTPQPVRKVFNCIVDDSALVAGVKRSTRNGIRQWVKNGQIRLFVPLHALEQLSRQKGGGNRHADDVRETLQWLDEATTKFPNAVALQGGDETYERWAEVEKFAVPRTLFSENDHLHQPEDSLEADSVPEDAVKQLTLADLPRKTPVSSAGTDDNNSQSASPSSMRSQRSSVSAMSPPTSPAKATSPPKLVANQPDKAVSSSSDVPLRLQPLFNYILWRIHQELDPVAALESFIFLCNDGNKVEYARGFEIRVKRLEQLREAIAREDRDFKNRQLVLNRENKNTSPKAVDGNQQSENENAPDNNDDDDDDEVVFKPAPRAPAAMPPKQQQQANMMDPDAFDRNAQPNPSPKAQPKSPRLQPSSPRATRNNYHAVHQNAASIPFAPRGNGRGNSNGGFRGAPGRGGRGNFGSPARAGFASNGRADTAAAAPATGNGNGSGNGNGNGGRPIDPNSFARPRGSGYTGRGGRKLWVPT